MKLKGEDVGHASVFFHSKEAKYALSGTFPAKSAVMDSIEIEETRRGRGLGQELLRKIEEDAKKNGMKRIYTTFTRNPEWFKKQGYKHAGRGSIFVKELK